jgi:hypothetical protein
VENRDQLFSGCGWLCRTTTYRSFENAAGSIRHPIQEEHEPVLSVLRSTKSQVSWTWLCYPHFASDTLFFFKGNFVQKGMLWYGVEPLA